MAQGCTANKPQWQHERKNVNNWSVRFQLDSGALILNTIQKFVLKEQIRPSSSTLCIWLGTYETLGKADIQFTNPKSNEMMNIIFAVVSNKLLLGSDTKYESNYRWKIHLDGGYHIRLWWSHTRCRRHGSAKHSTVPKTPTSYQGPSQNRTGQIIDSNHIHKMGQSEGCSPQSKWKTDNLYWSASFKFSIIA